jgi:hypothetical protein
MATSGAFFYSTSSTFVSSVAGFITSPVNTGSYFLKSSGPAKSTVPVDAPPSSSNSLPYNSALDLSVYPPVVNK